MDTFFKKALLLFINFIFLTLSVVKGQDSTDIDFTDFNVGCMFVGKLAPTYVINSEDEYNVLLNNVNNLPQCRSYSLPYINFSKYTLLGFLTADGGCDIQYSKSIKLVDETKTYVYTIQVGTVGSCKQLHQKTNFVLIPKVKEGYQVTFNKLLTNTKEE